MVSLAVIFFNYLRMISVSRKQPVRKTIKFRDVPIMIPWEIGGRSDCSRPFSAIAI